MHCVENLSGYLIHIEEDADTHLRYEIWFDYTQRAMNLIREGALLIVPNFKGKKQEEHYSILEIVSILPVHYALGEAPRGYPGFVVEAARSAAQDWETQEEESTEDVTKIRCIAMPTNFEIITVGSDEPKLQEESNIPKLGEKVQLLDTKSTEKVVNYGIQPTENTLRIGHLIRDEKVQVRVRVEELLRTHFAVFGFTGAGKSNLLSHLVHLLLTKCGECESCKQKKKCEMRRPIKIILFDLMSEYTTLLIPLLCRKPETALWIALDQKILPNPVVTYLANKEELEEAINTLCKTTLLPRALIEYRYSFAKAFKTILERQRLKIWKDEKTLETVLKEHEQVLYFGNVGQKKSDLNALFKKLVQVGGMFYDKYKEVKQQIDDKIKELEGQAESNRKNFSQAASNLKNFSSKLDNEYNELCEQVLLPKEASVTTNEIIAELQNNNQPKLLIIQSHDPDRLREFAARIGNILFDSRREKGVIEPPVCFLFDEADEFIPQQYDRDSSQAKSAGIVKTLARRGRKFGLGIGIATQRVRYLDTSIMAQPHTYFVSKMPRLTDRQAIAEAFGCSEEVLKQTFKFKKGDWLLMSHDATGLEAIPLPVHCPDANEKVREFLKSQESAE